MNTLETNQDGCLKPTGTWRGHIPGREVGCHGSDILCGTLPPLLLLHLQQQRPPSVAIHRRKVSFSLFSHEQAGRRRGWAVLQRFTEGRGRKLNRDRCCHRRRRRRRRESHALGAVLYEVVEAVEVEVAWARGQQQECLVEEPARPRESGRCSVCTKTCL